MNILFYDTTIIDIELTEDKTDITCFVLQLANGDFLVLRESDIYSPQNIERFRVLKSIPDLCAQAIQYKLDELAALEAEEIKVDEI
ncbi:MAG: hypothetical protein CVV49_00080 [Spirochaetae bacterium HGW-Spirochaetae-5]|nr:MAG: hypothetical protein CVV49_00080 [Spirochaetae bacterium HGW-Spirochaetae-5]